MNSRRGRLSGRSWSLGGRAAGPVLAVAGALFFPLMASCQAQAPAKSAYVTDQRDDVVRNATYLCWHTGFWTPAAAIADCDPDLVPKPAQKPVAQASGAAAPAAIAKPPAAPPPAASKPPPVMQKVTLSAETLFDFDRSSVKPEGQRRLDELVAGVSGVSPDAIIAVGHTDSVGGESYNRKLSLRRAEAVKAYLASKGVAPERISAEGRGEKQPLASNRTSEGRAKNRRVEVEVVGTSLAGTTR